MGFRAIEQEWQQAVAHVLTIVRLSHQQLPKVGLSRRQVAVEAGLRAQVLIDRNQQLPKMGFRAIRAGVEGTAVVAHAGCLGGQEAPAYALEDIGVPV